MYMPLLVGKGWWMTPNSLYYACYYGKSATASRVHHIFLSVKSQASQNSYPLHHQSTFFSLVLTYLLDSGLVLLLLFYLLSGLPHPPLPQPSSTIKSVPKAQTCLSIMTCTASVLLIMRPCVSFL